VEQRRLRVGDIVDDYCPRERRVTDHAVVAMVADAIQQTRCTACDAEHAYKGGSAPKRRKKETKEVLYNEVLSGMSDQTDAAPSKVVESGPSNVSSNGDAPGTQSPEEAPEAGPRDEGPVRRPLIRATLPRPEGIPKERPAPDFTIRQPGSRGFRDRDQGRAGRGFRFGAASGGGGRFKRGGAHPQQGGRQKKRSR
jgi:hypothetical protein